ncbi:MAG TPA: T9SS type A sorting domain-containing protein [Bacteroidia bacterium]|nr:T9SS type A sorting domain-containing protein [Bacteroidia bacterium]
MQIQADTCGFWGGPYCNPQNQPTWIGQKIEHTLSGLYRFFNLANDTLTFAMNINVGDTSLFYANASERFTIIYDYADTISVLGNNDSAHFYRIWHTDNAGTPIVSPLHQQTIIVAKQWGLVNFFRIDSFPQVEQPLALLGNVSPNGGMNAITSEMIYDYQPGDEEQYHLYQNCIQPCPPWLQYDEYEKYLFLSRNLTIDSLIYTVQRTRFSAGDILAITDTFVIAYFRHDTIATIPFELYDGKNRSLTYNDYCGQYYWTYNIYDPFQNVYCASENCWGSFDIGCCPNAHTSLIKYIPGIGLYRYQYNSIQFFAGNTYGAENIIYFKKNGIPCGTEQVVGIETPLNALQDISIFPNPSTDGIFSIDLSSSHLNNFFIDVYDIMGNKLYETSATALSNTHHLYLDKFSSGIYILRLVSNSATYMQKLIISR